MAKFIKSFFATPEKRRMETEEDKNDFTPPLDDRRTLSISRSGRMKQLVKVRHSLSLEVYRETNMTIEKPKSVEYHVHTPAKPVTETKHQRKHSGVSDTKVSEQKEKETQKRNSVEIKTPEEEIEIAFDIIEKVS